MEKINVSELLRNCPKGMELDCTMYDDVYFDYVDELNIIHCYIQHETHKTSITLNQHGTPNSDIKSKCVIFPKGKTTWEGFRRPFKDGEILATDLGSVFILKACLEDEIHYHSYIGVTFCNKFQEKSIPFAYKYACHLATDEEKQKLFDIIKENGYKWNPEAKTLEKLQKFKVGDKVRYKNDKTIITITGIKGNYYFIQFYNVGKCDYQNEKVSFKDQDKYELVPNKFDINTLVPFESRVLVRGDKNSYWKPAIFGCYMENMTIPYCVLGGNCWRYCIPYEGNEHLRGKIHDCDEYFKTWE